jgi:hypothetical protein
MERGHFDGPAGSRCHIRLRASNQHSCDTALGRSMQKACVTPGLARNTTRPPAPEKLRGGARGVRSAFRIHPVHNIPVRLYIVRVDVLVGVLPGVDLQQRDDAPGDKFFHQMEWLTRPPVKCEVLRAKENRTVVALFAHIGQFRDRFVDTRDASGVVLAVVYLVDLARDVGLKCSLLAPCVARRPISAAELQKSGRQNRIISARIPSRTNAMSPARNAAVI